MEQIKRMTLRAFDISNDKLSKSESDLMDKLKEKLHSSFAEDRRMTINSAENLEDLLSDFSINTEKYIYGVMMRLAPTKEVPNIPNDFFKKDKIQMDDLKGENKETLIACKDYYYFVLNNSHLITTLEKSTTIKRFQTYINWLLEVLRGKTLYELSPKLRKIDVKLSEVKNITFQDPKSEELNTKKKKESFDTSNKVITLAKDFVPFLFNSVSNLDDIMASDIVSAKLIVNFSKPRKMLEDDYQNRLSALLKPMSDLENLTIKTAKGTVNGQDILFTKKIDIETIESGRINEKQLIQEMESFLYELKK